MAETTRRLLRLLSLLESRAVWTGPELSDRLEVTTRTIRRDVDRLRDLGYPVMGDHGIGGGYRLGSGRRLPPLVLEDDEAVAVAVALRLAAMSSVEGLGESAIRTLSKLDQVLPARLREEVSALDTAMVTVDRRIAADVAPASLLTLSHGIRDEVRTRFTYQGRDAEATTRDVEPYRLVTTGRRWYLLAYDLDRDDWRTFRVDRILEPVPSTFRFRRRPEPDAAAFVQRSIEHTSRPVEATVRVNVTLEDLASRSWLDGVRRIDDDWCEFSTRAEDLRGLAWHLGWLGGALNAELRVISPPELRDEITRLSRRIASYATSPDS